MISLREQIAFVTFAGLLMLIGGTLIWIVANQQPPQVPVVATVPPQNCDVATLKADIDGIRARIDGLERVQARLVAAATGVK